MDSSTIHPTAQVDSAVELGPGVTIGPFAVIQGRVRIGARSQIGPSCFLQGPTEIGEENQLIGHCSVGTDPQDLKYGGEETFLRIGDRNVIREFVTINRGTRGGGGRTVVGDGNLLMTGVHIAHDCILGDQTILANAATLAGHVEVRSGATVGAFSGVHQFCRIGEEAFIGGYSVLTRDALPFVKTVGERGGARTYGINTVGLERKGFSPDRIAALEKAYRTLFRRKLKLKAALLELKGGELTEDVRLLLEFIESSERGFIR